MLSANEIKIARKKLTEIKKLENRIKSYLEESYVSRTINDKVNLQKLLTEYINRETAVNINFRRKNTEIKLNIQELSTQIHPFSDLAQKDELPKCETYRAKVFELIMFVFISRKFELVKRTNKNKREGSLPDYEFYYQNQKYYFEVTIRDASLMDQFNQFLPEFDNYFNEAKVLYEKAKELNWTNPWWSVVGELYYRIYSINNEIKNKIYLFEKWLYLNRYACRYFIKIIPSKLLVKLRTIDFPTSVFNSKTEIQRFKEHLTRCIAVKIIEKLEKKYFENANPVIVAISLATLPDFMIIPNIESLLAHIQTTLNEKLIEILKERIRISKDNDYKKNVEKMQHNIQHLFAILIDTTWYNWFPKTVKSQYGAKFEDRCENYYGIIYNKNISPYINKKFSLFESIINPKNCIEIDLDIGEI